MASSPKFESAGISQGTRRSAKGEGMLLPIPPSAMMAQYRTLIARTVDVFGDEIKASRWLSLPNRDFDGQTPLQVAQKTGYDLQAIEPILIRIEHGIDF
jgi:uncharacterized protein (DUF2384 family)